MHLLTFPLFKYVSRNSHHKITLEHGLI